MIENFFTRCNYNDAHLLKAREMVETYASDARQRQTEPVMIPSSRRPLHRRESLEVLP